MKNIKPKFENALDDGLINVNIQINQEIFDSIIKEMKFDAGTQCYDLNEKFKKAITEHIKGNKDVKEDITGITGRYSEKFLDALKYHLKEYSLIKLNTESQKKIKQNLISIDEAIKASKRKYL